MSGGYPFVAIIGLHGSGSSCLAGVVYHLGVHLGNRLIGYYGRDPEKSCGFEAAGLTRICTKAVPGWTTRRFVAPRELVAAKLRSWITDRQREAAERGTIAGGKYPELTLLHEECLAVCGDRQRLIVCERPLEDSIASLIRREAGKQAEELLRERQEWLWREKEVFQAKVPDHLVVPYYELLANPGKQIERIIRYLALEPRVEQIAKAARWPRPGRRHIYPDRVTK